jgi:hypothetical protein
MAPSSHRWMRTASRSNGTTGAKNAGYASRATSSCKVMNVPGAPVAEHLAAQGWRVRPHRTHLIVGADCEDDAKSLARRSPVTAALMRIRPSGQGNLCHCRLHYGLWPHVHI